METARDTKSVMDTHFSRDIKKFFKQIVYRMENIHIKSAHLLVLIVALSAFLRFYQFPSLPTGLQPDEVRAAYQSYALLQHGTDLWGNRWPVYFVGSASGQSVLLSYLNVPFIKLFGLTTFGIRLSSVLLSMLTIVIFYAFIKRWHGERSALIATFLLATSPWHIMLSRWSLDANLLPSFLLLGIACLSYCYTSPYARILIPFSLILLALSLYAYAIAIVILPFFLLLYFEMVGRETLWQNKRAILLSLLLFLLIAAPFLLFIVDNYLLHKTPSFLQHLPVTIPLLPQGSLAATTAEPNILASNLHFLLSGFNDGILWNVANGYAPLGILSFPMVALGIYYSTRTPRRGHARLLLIWLMATLPLFFLFPLDTVRANAIFLPLIALSGIGLSGLYDSTSRKNKDNQHAIPDSDDQNQEHDQHATSASDDQNQEHDEYATSASDDQNQEHDEYATPVSNSQNQEHDEYVTPDSDDHSAPEEFPTYTSVVPPQVAIISLMLVALILYNSLFCYYYFTNYNNDIKDTSNVGFGTALMQAKSSAYRNEPIYVSDRVDNNDLYTLFFLKVDPVDFQKHSDVLISNGTYQVRNYRNYYFSHNDPELNRSPSFIAIVKEHEWLHCAYGLLVYIDKGWTIERCFNGLASGI